MKYTMILARIYFCTLVPFNKTNKSPSTKGVALINKALYTSKIPGENTDALLVYTQMVRIWLL